METHLLKKKKIFYPFLREILKYQMQQITRLNPKITLLTSSRTPSIKTLPTITLLLYGTLPKSALLLCSGCARGMKSPKFDKLAYPVMSIIGAMNPNDPGGPSFTANVN